MEKTMIETINATAGYIRGAVGEMPDTAVILGTGLGDLVNQIKITKELVFNKTRIPRWRAFRQTDLRYARRQVYHGHARPFPLLRRL